MDFRVNDLEVFLAVARVGALTGAAHELRVTAGSVSKSLGRLERALRTRLFHRSARGVTLTAAGARALPLVEQSLANLRRVGRASDATEVTVAAAAYLMSAFLPAFAEHVPGVRLRGLQVTQPSVVALAARQQFDVALLTEAPALPSTWETHALGEVRYGLFAARAVAARLGRLTPERARSLTFITPIAYEQGQWVLTDDGCPLKGPARTSGHEVQTIALGLELAARTEQVVFGPVVSAARHVEDGRLAEVPVSGWDVAVPLTLALNVDRLTARHGRALLEAARAVLHQRSARGGQRRASSGAR